jgi:deoxyribodipyrimidine photo-lyase
VPELSKLEGAAVHEPWTAEDDLFGGRDGYPDPIVDHAAERLEALARYERIRS